MNLVHQLFQTFSLVQGAQAYQQARAECLSCFCPHKKREPLFERCCDNRKCKEVLLLRRQAQQKWDLATVCLDHMRLAVKGLVPLSSGVSAHYPGMAVMLQLLGALLPCHSQQSRHHQMEITSTAGRPLSFLP